MHPLWHKVEGDVHAQLHVRLWGRLRVAPADSQHEGLGIC